MAPRYTTMDKQGSLLVITLVYLAATLLGLEAAGAAGVQHPVWFVLIADVVATLVVFAFSWWYRNASVYDPYWSVIPVLIAFFWAFRGQGEGAVLIRQVLVVVLVSLWGVRLTCNWVLRWRGLGDEDWRFGMLRERHGRMYWLINLGGIHMLPTLLVLMGILATYPALADSSRDLNLLDGLAALVTGGAIWLEARADRILRSHRQSGYSGYLRGDVWTLCRHPNYLGEVLFWWGLYLFALAANPDWWWTGLGALAINALFIFISVPMMDNRLVERNPGYAEVISSIPALLPAPKKNLENDR